MGGSLDKRQVPLSKGFLTKFFGSTFDRESEMVEKANPNQTAVLLFRKYGDIFAAARAAIHVDGVEDGAEAAGHTFN